MELPVVQARKLVESDQLAWLDNLYQTSIPDGVTPSAKTTSMIISEFINEPQYYANGRFKGWHIGVEVQIIYALGKQLQIQDLEIKLATLFINNRWQIDQSKQHIKDPDTGQVSKVFYFTKNFILEKEDM